MIRAQLIFENVPQCSVKDIHGTDLPWTNRSADKLQRAFSCSTDPLPGMVISQVLSLCAIQVSAGSGFTGPSMNPAHAFSWNYFLDVRGFITCSVPVMLASSCVTQFGSDTPDAGSDSGHKRLEQRVFVRCAWPSAHRQPLVL